MVTHIRLPRDGTRWDTMLRRYVDRLEDVLRGCRLLDTSDIEVARAALTRAREGVAAAELALMSLARVQLVERALRLAGDDASMEDLDRARRLMLMIERLHRGRRTDAQGDADASDEGQGAGVDTEGLAARLAERSASE